MWGRIRERLTYANVVSTLALAAALGGGTAIAIDKINAESVDGVSADRVFFARQAKQLPTPFGTVLRERGLTLQAKCFEQSGHVLIERARSRRNNAQIQVAVNGLNQGNPDTEYVKDDDFDRGEILNIPETIQADNTLITIVYSQPNGGGVTALLQRELVGALGDTKTCLVAGHALVSP
jgi:hypothetical protein